MESTSEVVWKEQTKSAVSKKSVKEVSATSVQKLSTSVKTGADGDSIDNQISVNNLMMELAEPTTSNSLTLSSPFITTPSLDNDNLIDTSSMQSEFSAMKLKDESGNEIGKIVQEKQQQQSVKASSSSVRSADGDIKSTSSISQVSSSNTSSSSTLIQQSPSSILEEGQISSSSSSSTVADKSVCIGDLLENITAGKQLVKEEIPKVVDEDNKKIVQTVEKKNNVDHQTSVSSLTIQKEIEKEKEEEENEDEDEDEEEDDEDDDDDEEAKVVEVKEIVDKPDGGQNQIVTVPTEQNGTPCSTNETKEKPGVTTKETKATAIVAEKINTRPSSEASKDTNEEVPKEEEYDEETVKEEEEEEEEKEEEGEQKFKHNNITKVAEELEKSAQSCPQPVKKEKIPEEPECKQQQQPQEQPVAVQEETVVDAPFAVPQTPQQDNDISCKQDNLNNTIKNIISSIDNNIEAEENIAALKEGELELLKKQHQLAQELEQQKILAQTLYNENQLQQQQQQQHFNNNFFNRENKILSPPTNVTKYSAFDEKLDNNIYTKKTEMFESRGSSNVTKKIDLNKIFTPATDCEEILPKNRKLYASSAFYSPTIHPTVEDQVELARRISHSLSDISNQQSRGQSMYVNRKKRSVKWVHEGCGQVLKNKDGSENTKITSQEENDQEEEKENVINHHDEVPLKFLMNPSGQMRDINSLRESINTETGLLSPDVSAEVVTALQAQKGKGAELFAKRRKVSEKWIVDDSNVGAQSPSGLPDYHQCQQQQQPKPSTSPSILPAYTDAAKHRVQLNLHQEQLLEKYAKTGLKVVQTPWEAALYSGSASTAFVEEQKLSPYLAVPLTPSPAPQIYDASQEEMFGHSAPPTVSDSYSNTYSTHDYHRYLTHAAPQQQAQHERQYNGSNTQRELAYKPSIPQGWKAPSMSLPKVEFEEQKQIAKNCSSYEKQNHILKQDIALLNEDENLWQEYHTRDETELIYLMPREDINKDIHDSNLNIKQVVLKSSLQHRQAHDFTTHLVKSPELRLSPIPINTQIIYDNAVQELQVKRFKDVDKTVKSLINSQDNKEEKEERVSVRKHLKEYEDMQRLYAQQLELEQLVQKKLQNAKMQASEHNKRKVAANVTNTSDIALKSGIQQISEISKQQKNENDKEYVKVPVKELITNFEQQYLQEGTAINNHLAPSLPSGSSGDATLKKNIIMETEHRHHNDDLTKNMYEDLYMPKEIPLQSYAPPPVAVSPLPSRATYEKNQFNRYKPLNAASNDSPLASYNMLETTPAMNKTSEESNIKTFPVSKPSVQQGFSSKYGNSQPPKQQYLPPDSYQKVPQTTSQNVPQVSFNPSPLPYDKLAKFENQPVDEDRFGNSPPMRLCNPNIRGGRKVRYTSPAPFTGLYNRPYTPSNDSHHYGGTHSDSPRSLMCTQQYTKYNASNLTPPNVVTSNQILNAPSYNCSARGWGCSAGASMGYRQYPQSHNITANKPQIVNAASMPYTDF